MKRLKAKLAAAGVASLAGTGIGAAVLLATTPTRGTRSSHTVSPRDRAGHRGTHSMIT